MACTQWNMTVNIPWSVIQPQRQGNADIGTAWEKLEGIVQREISETEKEEYCRVSRIGNKKKMIPQKQRIKW